jgi:hypothetical protein
MQIINGFLVVKKRLVLALRIFTIKDGQLYTISYVSEASQYGRYLPTIENMIDSVVFTNDTGLQTTENNDLMFSSSIIRM